ncbi:MAG: hypothetical protein ACTHOB_07160 [Ginsengibacter sp.]
MSGEIFLDNQRFQFTIFPFEMKNSLGKVVAILQEYIITSDNNNFQQSSYKLYKTKEGNWYEIEPEDSKPDKTIRELKVAINSIESGLETVLS